MKNNRHEWRFFRAGGFDQVRIETGDDLLNLDKLDQKLWVALSCPVRGIEFDQRTLELMDSDQDGHIRAPEIIAAAQWAGAMLKNRQWLEKGEDTLPLEYIDDATAEGKTLLSAARKVLESLGKPLHSTISLADCADTSKIFAQNLFNGDGVITADAAPDADAALLIHDIIDCLGAVEDRSAKEGINAEKISLFFAAIESYATWSDKAHASAGILFMGEKTATAAAAWLEVKDKIADHFLRCEIVEYDARAGVLLSRSDDDFRLLALKDLSVADDEIAAFPLARPNREKSLSLASGLNPAWAARMENFTSCVAIPLLAESARLDYSQWQQICTLFRPYAEWMKSKPETVVAKLGEDRIQQIHSSGLKLVLDELVARDLALEPEMNSIRSIEKLLRYGRDLLPFANNFVSFSDFYHHSGKATFQVGTLYLDGRSCELCILVADINKHAILATLSRVCLVYCECVRGSEKINVAAAFTAGDSDQLMVGRNGIFYDRKGRDWNATIVRIIEHPISIRQAFWAPYKRTGKMIGEQLQKIATSRSKNIEEQATKGVLDSAQKPPAFDVAKFAGIFAAIGLAVGAVGTALATMVTGLLGLKWWQLPLAASGILAVISGPSVLIALFKLRQRNLGPILDANGWAVNARALINIPFGTSLTATAKLPEGSERSLVDPFADKKHPLRWVYFGLLLFALLYFAYRKFT